MRRLFVYAGLVSFLFACQNEVEIEEPKSVYEIQSIEYFQGEGDGISTDSIYWGKQSVVNRTNDDLSPFGFHWPEAKESSRFSSDELFPELYNQEDTIWVKVPELIGSKLVFLNKNIRAFSLNRTEEVTSNIEIENTYTLTPHTQLSVELLGMVQKTSLRYKAVLKEINSKKLINVEGQWIGTKLIGFKSFVKYDDVK